MSDADAVAEAIEEVIAELGAPTVLVNNAGVTRDNLLSKMSEADWDTVIGVHLRGAFLMTRAVQKHMVAARWGRVVNMSSTVATAARFPVGPSTARLAGNSGIPGWSTG